MEVDGLVTALCRTCDSLDDHHYTQTGRRVFSSTSVGGTLPERLDLGLQLSLLRE